MLAELRDSFFEGLYDIVKKDKNVFILTADHGAFGLAKIQKDFPDQFLNVGIAEQNMVSIAAGLAKCGKIVYIYSINNFISLRCLEHVNIDICSMNLHVNFIGVGAGFTYSKDGPSHQGVQDMQSMMILPNMHVYNVTDYVSSRSLALLSYNKKGPKYFRIEKGELPKVYNNSEDFSKGFSLVKNHSENILISTGYMTSVAINVAKNIDNLGVIDLYRVKPINEKLLASVISNTKNVITLEECTPDGGMCEKIGYIIAKKNINVNFLPIFIESQHCYHYGTREMLHKKYDIDLNSVVNKIKTLLEKK